MAAANEAAGATLDAALGGGGEAGASPGVLADASGAGGDSGIPGVGPSALGSGTGTVGAAVGVAVGGGIAGGDTGAGAGGMGCARGAGIGEEPGACAAAATKRAATATRWRRAMVGGDGRRRASVCARVFGFSRWWGFASWGCDAWNCAKGI
jgi:hypothetical protein